VRRAAQRKGLQSPALHELDAEALLRLLLGAGISTSAAVTEVSGRGVGLDVVREAAEHVGGEVAVHTAAGKGTAIELIVPPSLAALDALIVQCSAIAAAIPLVAARRALRVAPAQIARAAQGESVLHDGHVMSFVALSRLLGVDAEPARNGRSWPTVVVQGAGESAALAVDRFMGVASVVVRPLPHLTPAASLVVGSFLDPEGNLQLVIDPDEVVAEAGMAGAPAAAPEVARPPVMVIDDSLTTRMLEQSILESAGFEVHAAVSGEDALEEARRKRYALFLVDIEMPGMDGFAFIERTRGDPALRDIPAILVSSRASPEDMLRGQTVGAKGYIVKSDFDQAEFLARVRRLVT
jgi:two-component system chemotaxis sensor kinase CheA